MEQEPRHLPWVTPAKYVGPSLVILALVTTVLVATFLINGRSNEAIITLLAAICLFLVGLADLLGELIVLTARKCSRPEEAGRLEDSARQSRHS
jgi:hypothetical protein